MSSRRANGFEVRGGSSSEPEGWAAGHRWELSEHYYVMRLEMIPIAEQHRSKRSAKEIFELTGKAYDQRLKNIYSLRLPSAYGNGPHITQDNNGFCVRTGVHTFYVGKARTSEHYWATQVCTNPSCLHTHEQIYDIIHEAAFPEAAQTTSAVSTHLQPTEQDT